MAVIEEKTWIESGKSSERGKLHRHDDHHRVNASFIKNGRKKLLTV